jgi:peptide/nickel transport system ATP-binding protein
VGEALALHRGLSGSSVRSEAKRLFDLVGIPDSTRRLDAYPHELSGGQNQRVMIAMALAGEPDLLVADEPTTALDATIQAQILDLLNRIRRETGMALALISHDLGAISETCDRICVMYAGRIVEETASHTLFGHPLHHYSRGLLDALPPLDGKRRRLDPIRGSVPEPWNLPPGCPFAPRCPQATAACDETVPILDLKRSGHRAACIRVDEVDGRVREYAYA